MTTDDQIMKAPHSNTSLPEREAVGYLIYAWDAATGTGDRTRGDYLQLADSILALRRERYLAQ